MSTFHGTEWLARRWDKSPRWITQQARANKIPGAMKLEREWRFDEADIIAHENANKTGGVFALSAGAKARRAA